MGENKQQAHRALYRKYRPKSLSGVIGQEHITTILTNAVDQKKVNHAYLFTGPRGTGKTSIARILAYEINGLDYTDDTQQLDIIEIDAASNRRIDDIRELREKVHIAPVSSAFKVYIIDEVHMLTPESFNALLKTLEEPPSHVIFILATTEIHKLPATILSRVQRHNFRLIDTKKITDHLARIAKQEGIDIDMAALELLAKHGGGSFRDSISLLDQLSAHGAHIDKAHVQQLLGVAPTELVVDVLSKVESGNYSEILQAIEQMILEGLTPASIATALIEYMRSAILEKQEKPYYLKLMQQLLDVSGAPYKQLKLESILLQINERSDDTQTVDKIKPSDAIDSTTSAKPTESPSQNKRSISNKIPQTEHKSNENSTAEIARQTKKTSEVSSDSSSKSISKTKTSDSTQKHAKETHDVISSWQTILDAIKIKHNPLYTLLRVGTPTVSDGTLILSFSFPFHKKKLEDPKYKALLAETIFEITGLSIAIESTVDKTKIPNTLQKPDEDTAHASQISAVRDMMGGGEVVNV